MPTPTAHYDILKPQGADPFLTSDFADNYDKIDAAIYAAKQRADSAYALAEAAGAGGGGGGGGGGTGNMTGVNFTKLFYDFSNITPNVSGSPGVCEITHSAGFVPIGIVITGAGYAAPSGGSQPPVGGTANLPISVLVVQDSFTTTKYRVKVFVASVDQAAPSTDLDVLPNGQHVVINALLLGA